MITGKLSNSNSVCFETELKNHKSNEDRLRKSIIEEIFKFNYGHNIKSDDGDYIMENAVVYLSDDIYTSDIAVIDICAIDIDETNGSKITITYDFCGCSCSCNSEPMYLELNHNTFVNIDDLLKFYNIIKSYYNIGSIRDYISFEIEHSGIWGDIIDYKDLTDAMYDIFQNDPYNLGHIDIEISSKLANARKDKMFHALVTFENYSNIQLIIFIQPLDLLLSEFRPDGFTINVL
jgi:hypothetical protein